LKLRDCLGGVVVFSLVCGTASAATLLNVTDMLTDTDSTQLGRLSRNGLPQDWAGSEAFPGVFSIGTSYFYQTYFVNVGERAFVQISLDDVATSEFVSAYVGAYSPNSAGSPNFGFDTNWLGDAGTSGNYFGVDPVFFQVIVPANSTLVVVVNNTTGGALPVSNGTYNLLVEGFYDQDYSESPEPSGAILMTAALGALGLFGRRVYRPTSLS
jgi:hypothetical protein